MIPSVVLICVILGLVIWDMRFRSTADRNDAERNPHLHQRADQPTSPTRFKGNGTIPLNTPHNARRSPRRSPRSRTPARPRFSGTARRDPNAIGVACGRPISECTRGEDCLCLD
jgi:hypothetical protein